MEGIKRVMRREESRFSSECSLSRDDTWFHLDVSRLDLPDSTARVLSVHRDITVHRMAEEASV
jgi:hypothetical protein